MPALTMTKRYKQSRAKRFMAGQLGDIISELHCLMACNLESDDFAGSFLGIGWRTMPAICTRARQSHCAELFLRADCAQDLA